MKRLTLLIALIIALSAAASLEAKSHRQRPSGKVIDCIVNNYSCEHFCYDQEVRCSYRCTAFDGCQEACDREYFACKASCQVSTCGPMQMTSKPGQQPPLTSPARLSRPEKQ